MQVQQVLEQIVCFSLEDISLWGARKKLRSEDLKLTTGDALPPKDLASLGSKKIFNPKALAKFEALKRRAHVACGRVGVRFMGGYAVPSKAADQLATELDAIGVEFEKEKTDFLANYTSELETWIAAHPGWEEVIRAATVPVTEVKDRIRYGWMPAKVSAPDENLPTSRLHQKMVKEAGGLAGRLFSEISEMAKAVVEDSLLGKTRVNRRVLSPVRRMRGKLDGLAILDKRVRPLIKAIDETVAQMPGDAPIEGVSLTALHGLMLMLSDPERMKQYGQAILDGSTDGPSLGIRLAPQQSVSTAPVAEEPALMPNLFEDTPVVAPVAMPQIVAATEETVVLEEPNVPEEPAVKVEAAEEVPTVTEVPQFAEASVPEAPMVRVVEVVKEVAPQVVPMMPPPALHRPRPVRRVTF